MIAIPAMDLIAGRCVRLQQGDFSRTTVHADDPVAVAEGFRAAGVRYLHMVDLDGARAGSPQHLHLLEQVARTGLTVDYSGGVRSEADVQAVLDAGATYVAVGSMAVRAPVTVDAWMQRFGAERFLLGADVRDGMLAVEGWQQQTDVPLRTVIDRFAAAGGKRFFCTDISKDGMGQGPATVLYAELAAAYPQLEVIASGGVASIADLEALQAAGCAGAIVGKAIYAGSITLQQLAPWLH